MDVIPDAGSVLGRIVSSKDLDACSAPERHIENQRNQMRLRLMRLAVAFDSTRHIEVAKARIFESMTKIHPAKHLFDQELDLAVSIGGLELCVINDRGCFGLPVARGSRTE